jgi:hypothetical protein
MDLATRIRLGLAEGKSPDLVVSELVAGGMTESTARRLVDRAASQPAPLPPAADASAAEDSSDSGRSSLIAGAFFASLGVAITAFTYIRARPGQEFIITYGMVFGGLAMAGKGFQAWWKAGARDFPTRGVTIAAVFPIVLFFGPLGWFTWRESTREARELAAQLDAEQAAEAAEREATDKARQTRIAAETADTQRAVQALQLLIDGSPAKRCAGARILGDLKQLDPSGELDRVAATDPDTSVRDCANAAIASIRDANPDAFRRARD